MPVFLVWVFGAAFGWWVFDLSGGRKDLAKRGRKAAAREDAYAHAERERAYKRVEAQKKSYVSQEALQQYARIHRKAHHPRTPATEADNSKRHLKRLQKKHPGIAALHKKYPRVNGRRKNGRKRRRGRGRSRLRSHRGRR